MENKVKRKKSKLVRYSLSKDCRKCVREKLGSVPLVEAMSNPAKTNVTLLNLNHSLEWLKKFTKLTRDKLPEILIESGGSSGAELSAIMSVYLDDIDHLLDVFVRMRDMAVVDK